MGRPLTKETGAFTLEPPAGRLALYICTHHLRWLRTPGRNLPSVTLTKSHIWMDRKFHRANGIRVTHHRNPDSASLLHRKANFISKIRDLVM
jgi:hypothetical protein